MSIPLQDLGIVIIGRNEGKRLLACLRAVAAPTCGMVYVDSGSTDGSPSAARGLGAEVLALDLTIPFTAARARNAGWRHLLSRHPGMRYVQFVDGDCELDPAWLEIARAFLERSPETAVACGRCRERQPEASVYNRLCDIEWDTPVGPAAACGGNAMLRLSALAESGGFDEVLIAGEEPELCFRLRRAGWGVQRLAAEMVRHDAAIFSWRQWWQRNQRAGFSYANGCHLHGASSERYYRRELRSILFWGLALPVSALTMAWVHPLGLAILLVYPLQYWRLKRRFRAEGRIPAADCGQYAIHLIAGKFPSLLGVLSFHRHRLQGRRRSLIEYK